jgi:hypothetical protein
VSLLACDAVDVTIVYLSVCLVIVQLACSPVWYSSSRLIEPSHSTEFRNYTTFPKIGRTLVCIGSRSCHIYSTYCWCLHGPAALLLCVLAVRRCETPPLQF